MEANQPLWRQYSFFSLMLHSRELTPFQATLADYLIPIGSGVIFRQVMLLQ